MMDTDQLKSAHHGGAGRRLQTSPSQIIRAARGRRALRSAEAPTPISRRRPDGYAIRVRPHARRRRPDRPPD